MPSGVFATIQEDDTIQVVIFALEYAVNKAIIL